VPEVTLKAADMSPPSITRASILSWKERIMNLSGQPIFAKMAHKPSLFNVSKALVRSINIRNRSLCCSIHFSWSCRSEKIMSMVDRPARKPHWLSDSMPFDATYVVRQSDQHGTCQNLTRYRKQWYSTVVVTVWAITFLFVEVHYGCIFKCLWHRFFLPDESEETLQPVGQRQSTVLVHFRWYAVRSSSLSIWQWLYCTVDFMQWRRKCKVVVCWPLRNLWCIKSRWLVEHRVEVLHPAIHDIWLICK